MFEKANRNISWGGGSEDHDEKKRPRWTPEPGSFQGMHLQPPEGLSYGNYTKHRSQPNHIHDLGQSSTKIGKVNLEDKKDSNKDKMSTID